MSGELPSWVISSPSLASVAESSLIRCKGTSLFKLTRLMNSSYLVAPWKSPTSTSAFDFNSASLIHRDGLVNPACIADISDCTAARSACSAAFLSDVLAAHRLVLATAVVAPLMAMPAPSDSTFSGSSAMLPSRRSFSSLLLTASSPFSATSCSRALAHWNIGATVSIICAPVNSAISDLLLSNACFAANDSSVLRLTISSITGSPATFRTTSPYGNLSRMFAPKVAGSSIAIVPA